MKEIMKLLGLLLLLTSASTLAQDKFRMDSLITQLQVETADSSRCRIMLEIAEAYHSSDTAVTLFYLRKVRTLGASMNDKNYQARSFLVQGKMKISLGQYEEAIIDYDRAMAFFTEANNNVAYYETMKEKGNAHLFSGNYAQAKIYYETALDYFKRNNLPGGASRCLNNLGIIYKNHGNYVEALQVYKESIELLIGEDDPMQVARGYINMGNVFVYLGNYEEALGYFEDAREIVEKEGSTESLALILINTGVVLNKCNSFFKAHEYYTRALELSRAIDDPTLISNCLVNIGTNYSSLGRLEEALEYVEKGWEMKKEIGDPKSISNSLVYMAEILSLMEEYDRATELFYEAIPVKEDLGDIESLARCYLGLASISLAHKEYRKASRMSDLALEYASSISSLEHLTSSYAVKRDIALARGDYKLAYDYEHLHNMYHDSVLDDDNTRAAMEMEFRHRSRALEKENNNLKIQSELAEQLMKKKNALMKSVAGIAILLAALLILGVYFLSRMRLSSLKLEEKNLVITRQNMELDNMNRSKDRMMSIIAHDLRGTMGNQITAIDVLHRVEVSGNQNFDKKKLMSNLKNSASYSLELLENLLHWSRLEENANHFNPELIKLDTIVTACMAVFDESALIKNVEIIKQVEEGLMLKGDRIMLEAIIRNLLSNAIKFTESGGNIQIIAKQEEESIRVEVIDTGIGMTSGQIDKVLNNGGFTSRGTANEKGAGIGMTLVREFTAMHKGSLEIISEPGMGSTMLLIFPINS